MRSITLEALLEPLDRNQLRDLLLRLAARPDRAAQGAVSAASA